MVRMWGVSPRFSWITSTAPFGSGAVARTPISSPGVRRSGSRSPAAGAAVPPAAPEAGVVEDSSGGRAARRRCSRGRRRRGRRRRRWRRRRRRRPPAGRSPRRPVTPSRPRRRSASRRDSRPGLAVEGDLLHDVVLERHRRTLGPSAVPLWHRGFVAELGRLVAPEPGPLDSHAGAGFARYRREIRTTDLVGEACYAQDDRSDLGRGAGGRGDRRGTRRQRPSASPGHGRRLGPSRVCALGTMHRSDTCQLQRGSAAW